MDSIQPGDPTRVGSYRVLGRLGAGGMGRVYLGMSLGGRKVAIKVITPEYADSPQFRSRFAREVEAARRVGGFHAAQVVDADPDARPPWMVTAYVEGPTLAAQVAASGPMPAARVRELGAQLAEGLAAIHAAGLVHRDLKPGNVILAADGPRIIDFGIARPAQSASLTTTGFIVGTIEYMSPEQARGETAGPASDVFSLGAVLAFALTGSAPHKVRPGELDVTPHEPLRDVITACLVGAPALRPSTASILAALAAEGAMAQDHPAGAAAAHPGHPAAAGPGAVAAAPPGRAGPTPAPATVPPQASSFPAAASSAHLPAAPAAAGPRGAWLPSRRGLLFSGLGAAAAAAIGVPVGLELSSGTPDGTANDAATRTSSPAATASGVAPVGKALNKRVILEHGTNAGAQSVSFSPNGHVLASGNGDGTVKLFDVRSQKAMSTLTHRDTDSLNQAPSAIRPTSRSVFGVAFSPDGSMLAAANGDGTVGLWNVGSGKNIATLRTASPAGTASLASSVAFSPDGSMIASSYNAASVTLWKVSSRQAIATLPAAAGQWIHSVAFSRDGRLLAAGSRPPGDTATSGMVSVWNIAARTMVTTLAQASTAPGALAFSHRELASVNADGTVSVWNLRTQSTAAVLANARSDAKSVAFKADGTELMSGNNDGTGSIWNRASKTVSRTINTGSATRVPSVAFSPNAGEPGLACGGGNLVLWTYQG